MHGVSATTARRLAALIATGAAWWPAAASAETLVVDRDGAQCENAGFTSIQDAVDAASPGDHVRVCADTYPESVTVKKPLRIQGPVGAVAKVDCFSPATADPTRQAIVEPAADGFSVGVRLLDDDITVRGLVVQGADVGIDASDGFSGYRIAHNLLQSNTLFGMDFGSSGERHSRVDHNCFRANQYGVVTELDDDSQWQPKGGGPERRPENARDLVNARVDNNQTYRNLALLGGAGIDIAGPGRHDHVLIDWNESRSEGSGVVLQNARRSGVIANDVRFATGTALSFGGGLKEVEIRSNRVADATGTGLRIQALGFLDPFGRSAEVLMTDNEIRRSASGILISANNLSNSQIVGNTTSDNRGNGIGITAGNTAILVRGNRSDDNGASGISLPAGATGNWIEFNSMHRNAAGRTDHADARDLNVPPNAWIGNDCETELTAPTVFIPLCV